jgi:hypothetical protein
LRKRGAAATLRGINMNGFGSTDEHQPVTWFRGHAIFAAHFVVLVFVVSLVVTAVLQATNSIGVLSLLPFTSSAVLHGEIWRIFTYGLYNPPSLWFVIDMLMIVWFGRELERFFGRGKFLRFFGVLYLLPPLLFTALGLVLPTQLAGQMGGFALFVGFATLYPNVSLLFNILAKWAAIILVALYSLIHFSNRDTAGLLSLWATCGFAFCYVRYQQGIFRLPSLRLPRSQPKLRVLPDLKTKSSSSSAATRAPAAEATMVEVDALLEKIAQSGMSSLTAKERAKLDAARDDLMKRRNRGR